MFFRETDTFYSLGKVRFLLGFVCIKYKNLSKTSRKKVKTN
ncbi:hypothetical protein LEP1GSC073_0425 [Leptospira noguchii str. Cascata]|nr:hypothetical protein LEP1GSC072_1234 [Leptospira noguchii str. Bonito]EMS85764.1 hypothetical protein LEP1GSC073_0425 [Leptospira noguchii str. Cascata]